MLERHPSLCILIIYFTLLVLIGAVALMAIFSFDSASDYLGISMSDAGFIIRTWLIFSTWFWIVSGYIAFYTIVFIGYSKQIDLVSRILVATAIYVASCALFDILIGDTSTLSASDILKYVFVWGCVVAAEVITNRICRRAFRVLQASR